MEIGQKVIAYHKTGKYVGKVTEVHEDHYVVRVLAVLKHPIQGNLHHPRQVDVPYFHERKAKTFREQTNIPKNMVRTYEGDIPNYTDSLKKAVKQLLTELAKEDTSFNKKSIECLRNLQRDYELMYDIKF